MPKLGKSVLRPYRPSKKDQERLEDELRRRRLEEQKVGSEQPLRESMPEDQPKEEKIDPIVGRTFDSGNKPSESKDSGIVDSKSELRDAETEES